MEDRSARKATKRLGRFITAFVLLLLLLAAALLHKKAEDKNVTPTHLTK